MKRRKLVKAHHRTVNVGQPQASLDVARGAGVRRDPGAVTDRRLSNR